jgi:two-component system, LytTR family, response regulator
MIKAVLLQNSLHSDQIISLAKSSGIIEITNEFKLSNDVFREIKNINADLLIISSSATDDKWMKQAQALPGQPLIIYIAPNGSLASTAYEMGIEDYIQTPLKKQRVLLSFTRIREKYLHRIGRFEAQERNYFIREKDTLQKVKVDEINFIQAFGDYVNVFTTGKKYTIHSTIKNMEARLPQEQFVRIHRSFIINLKKVIKIVDDKVFLNSHEIPIGEAFKSELMSHLSVLK